MAEFFKDIPYASQSATQKLDIYLPEGFKEPYPVVIWLHPGGFSAGDKDMIKPFAAALTAGGYAAVSVNYRLTGEAGFPAQIYDAKAAVRWVRASAAKYNLSPDKIAAWGISAGAALAALLGTASGVKELEDLSMGNAGESSRVSAVVDWYGPTDFIALNSQRRQSATGSVPENIKSGESQLLGGSFSEVPENYRAASPLYHINAQCPPFYIQHGTADDVIPCEQSIKFAEALEAAIGKDNVELHLVANAGHFDRVHSSAENVNAVLDFLNRHLK